MWLIWRMGYTHLDKRKAYVEHGLAEGRRAVLASLHVVLERRAVVSNSSIEVAQISVCHLELDEPAFEKQLTKWEHTLILSLIEFAVYVFSSTSSLFFSVLFALSIEAAHA